MLPKDEWGFWAVLPKGAVQCRVFKMFDSAPRTSRKKGTTEDEMAGWHH